ncbi:protein kinase domain-containing protein [Legionella impletisoli]|uniref:Protein kinase domain-containing protein n=1 Tax=Legionella impletisoli TaxID=343510 RepID=A0A917NCS9_9GAMM|nr:protein kinase family protein [Legionella impletisoli]GGI85037.1 hypothetical protein GCM10007966_12030 [Legionella impletisoli]
MQTSRTAQFLLYHKQSDQLLDVVTEVEPQHLGGGSSANVWTLQSQSGLDWVVKRERLVSSVYYKRILFFNESKFFREVYGKHSAFYFRSADDGSEPSQVVMRRLPGKELSNNETELTTPEDFVNAILAVLYSIKNLHKKGVVHGDIKGDNINLHRQPDGRFAAYPIDFGFSQFVGQFTIGGYADYMPTELKQRIPADFWQDSYMLCDLMNRFVDHYIFKKNYHHLKPLGEFICDNFFSMRFMTGELQYSVDGMIQLWTDYALHHNLTIAVVEEPINALSAEMEQEAARYLKSSFFEQSLERIKRACQWLSQYLSADELKEVTDFIEMARTLTDLQVAILKLLTLSSELSEQPSLKCPRMSFFKEKHAKSVLDRLLEMLPRELLPINLEFLAKPPIAPGVDSCLSF